MVRDNVQRGVEGQAAARGAGWEFGVDSAARDGASIGGTIATDAGGEHAVHHGRPPGRS